jgi:hypothetical protein
MVSNNHIYSSIRSFNLQIGLLESSVIPVYVDVKNINVWLIYYYFIELWSCTSDAAVLCHLFEMSLISLRSNMECFIIIFVFLARSVILLLTSPMILTQSLRRNELFAILFSIEKWKRYEYFVRVGTKNIFSPFEDKIWYLLYVIITK